MLESMVSAGPFCRRRRILAVENLGCLRVYPHSPRDAPAPGMWTELLETSVESSALACCTWRSGFRAAKKSGFSSSAGGSHKIRRRQKWIHKNRNESLKVTHDGIGVFGGSNIKKVAATWICCGRTLIERILPGDHLQFSNIPMGHQVDPCKQRWIVSLSTNFSVQIRASLAIKMLKLNQASINTLVCQDQQCKKHQILKFSTTFEKKFCPA